MVIRASKLSAQKHFCLICLMQSFHGPKAIVKTGKIAIMKYFGWLSATIISIKSLIWKSFAKVKYSAITRQVWNTKYKTFWTWIIPEARVVCTVSNIQYTGHFPGGVRFHLNSKWYRMIFYLVFELPVQKVIQDSYILLPKIWLPSLVQEFFHPPPQQRYPCLEPHQSAGISYFSMVGYNVKHSDLICPLDDDALYVILE